MKEHAVIIGGSVAGLLAAGVLAKHFKKVTILDGDTLGCGSHARRATPQSYHVHGLLNSGWAAVQQIFPGIEKELKAYGAHWVNFGKEFRWHHFGKVKAQFEELMEGPFMSRGCFETALYERVSQFEHFSVIQNTKVKQVLGSAERVTGVVTETGEEISADFVVDTSGRASSLTRSLQKFGLKEVKKETIPARLRYASFRFTPAENFSAPWKALFVTPKPPLTQAGAIFPISNGEWIVTVSGRDKDTMPTNLEGFLDYAARLHTPELRDALEGATVLSELKSFRYNESRRFYYEDAAMPSNLVVLGDAFCSFNPIFGQGMTVCAMEAMVLDEQLQQAEFSAAGYFENAAKVINRAWKMIKVEDMRHAYLHDHIPLKVKFCQWFSNKVYVKTSYDGVLTKAFYEVIHLTRPSRDLMKLPMLWRIFR